jgi:hypothetical protein
MTEKAWPVVELAAETRAKEERTQPHAAGQHPTGCTGGAR